MTQTLEEFEEKFDSKFAAAIEKMPNELGAFYYLTECFLTLSAEIEEVTKSDPNCLNDPAFENKLYQLTQLEVATKNLYQQLKVSEENQKIVSALAEASVAGTSVKFALDPNTLTNAANTAFNALDTAERLLNQQIANPQQTPQNLIP